MNNRLHVGSLAVETSAATLEEAFRCDGRQVLRVQLVMSREPGRSRGFGFVDMASEADASAAMSALHGATIDGRIVRVSLARAPKSRFGGRVGGLPQAKPAPRT